MINSERINLRFKKTIDGNYTYIGLAPVTALESDATWQVFMIDKTSGTVMSYAKLDGVPTDQFVFDALDLTSLDY